MMSFLEVPLLQKRIWNSAHDDEDCAQTVQLKLLELAHRRPGYGNKGIGYHIRMAAWLANDYRRRGYTYNRNVFEEPMVREGGEWVGMFDEILPCNSLSPEEFYLRKEALEQLQWAIDQLTPKQRRIIELLAEGYRQEEIMAKLGITQGNASQATMRARKSLKGFLKYDQPSD